MAACNENIDYILREWAPLTELFDVLPTKLKIKLFTYNVKITCIDVLPEFLALGSNLGVVFWYDRKTKDVKQLWCEKENVEITALKIISTVEFMVACGTKDGTVYIFQIPKSYPDSIPESLKPKNKQIERYTVADLHKSAVTAIEWSKNGENLFSGDKNGCIVLTEINFSMHITRSWDILNESYKVVQLSYYRHHLLVSTTYRSIICQKREKWEVCQVGKKDRKSLGNFGGLIYKSGPKASDLILYCIRPGLRMWIADCEGNVMKTLSFKDFLHRECAEVPIINPISKNLKMLKPQMEPSFGILLPFSDNLLLTCSSDIIYILDPQKVAIICTMSQFRNVLSVATYKDEIFVLEGERSLVRISYRPEPNYGQNSASSSTSNTSLITNSIKGITSKLQSTSIIPAISPFVESSGVTELNVYTDSSLIMNAEEAKESPIRSRTINPEIEKKFDDIGKREFSEQILYKQTRLKKKHSISINSLSSNSSEEKDNAFKPTLMTLNSFGVLPDLRSPESIQNDIEYKEKILAEMLNLGEVKISIDKLQEITEICDDEPPTVLPKDLSCLSFAVEDNVEEDKTDDFNKEGSGSNHSTTFSQSNSFTIEKTPDVVRIPNDWKLTDIHLNARTRTDTSSDTSSTEWEIV